MHLHPPPGGEKNLGVIYGKFVNAPPAHQVHPQAEQESIFRTFWGDLEVRVVDLVVLDRLLRATS